MYLANVNAKRRKWLIAVIVGEGDGLPTCLVESLVPGDTAIISLTSMSRVKIINFNEDIFIV